MENVTEMVNIAAVDAMLGHITTCRKELAAIAFECDLMADHYAPDRVSFATAGSFGHLAELLKEARQFITGEEE